MALLMMMMPPFFATRIYYCYCYMPLRCHDDAIDASEALRH